MTERNKMRTKMLAALCAAAVLAVFWLVWSGKAEQWLWEHSGIPDAVSSICGGAECRLTVVANAGSIEDREEFAREVALKYGENSFRSIRFSRDAKEQPSIVYIAVYLKRGDIGKTGPVMRIRLESPKSERTGAGKEEVMGEYRIYLDDRRIGSVRVPD